jgi:hypothetical protein
MTRFVSDRKPRAFVLISFEEEFESVYTELIATPLIEAGFEVQRADSRLDQQNILRDIILGISSADLIVADLTGLNPNVFYELGIAHALGIPTVLLTQNLEDLPFDLRAYRANEYSTHFADAPKVVGTVREIAAGRITGSITFGSPVTDFLPPDFNRRPSAAGALAVPEELEEAPTEPEPELAWFDALAEGETRIDEFVIAMEQVAQATEQVGQQIAAHTLDLERATAGPEAQRVKAISALTIRVAHDLDAYADALLAELPLIEDHGSSLLDGMSQYLDWLQSNPDAEASEQVGELREAASGLLQATRENVPILQEFRGTMASLRGVSRPINSASARVTQALDRLITATETIEARAARIVTVSEALEEGAGAGHSASRQKATSDSNASDAPAPEKVREGPESASTKRRPGAAAPRKASQKRQQKPRKQR